MTECQQEELYAAERQVPQGRLFASLEEIQEFLDQLRDESWYVASYGTLVKRIEVGPARPGRGSVGWYEASNAAGRVEMAPVHRNQLFVCHEVAHVLAAAVHGSKSHDPFFARIYLELTYHVLGSDAFVALLRAFNDAGIVHDPLAIA